MAAHARKSFAKRRTLYGDQKESFPKLPTVDLQGHAKTIRHGRYSNLYTAGSRLRHVPLESMGKRMATLGKSVAFRSAPAPIAGPAKDGQLLAAKRKKDAEGGGW